MSYKKKNSSQANKSKEPSLSLFHLITVPNVKIPKQIVFDLLAPKCEMLIVGEKELPEFKSSDHRIGMKLWKKMNGEEVRAFVSNAYPGVSKYSFAFRQKQNWQECARIASELDFNPLLKNVCTDELS
jgi:hypothetical protein